MNALPLSAQRSTQFFGSYLLLLGSALIVAPNPLLALFGLASTQEVWIRVAGVLVVNIGVFFWMAAVTDSRAFLLVSVGTRTFLFIAFIGFVLAQLAPPILILFAGVDMLAVVWTLHGLALLPRRLAGWVWKALAFALAATLVLMALTQVMGHGYILAAVRDTYLIGRLTPAITIGGSSLTRHVREVRVGTPQPWPQEAPDQRVALPRDLRAQMTAYRTAAFLVVRDGVVRNEVYWPGFDERARTNSNSVAKSFVGTLIGVAVAEGKIRSLAQPVGDYLPAFARGARAKLTIRHLLTMSAATDFAENYDNPLDFPARAHYGSDIAGLLEARFNPIGEPGITHKYDSSNTAVLGLVLAQATSKSLSDYASEKLWQPMGAEHSALWSLDVANGTERAYCCLYATARDYARLGQLYLNGGVWNGRQLVPADYIAQAIQAAPLKDASGAPTERYGYSWWRMTYRGHAVYYAWGYQGQYIAVIPDKKIVMVRLGDGGGYTEEHDNLDLPLYLDAALLNAR